VRRVLVGTIGAGLALALTASPAAAADGSEVSFTGSLDDRSLSSIDANSPAELDPEEGTVLSVEVRNGTDEVVEVRSVRLSATVLGLAFMNYTTRIDLAVEPGDTGTRTFALDLGDLGGQARGLLPGSVELLDADRQVVAGQDVPLDVQGSLRSVYGVFGLGIGAITALLFLSLLVRLGAGRLPVNRWSRAWRFAIPGIGLGLTTSLTLSVLRLALPSRTLSLALVVAGVLVGLAIGYLTPAPDDGTGREDVYEEDFAAAPSTPDSGQGVGGLRFSLPVQSGARADDEPAAPPAPAHAAGPRAPAPPTQGGPESPRPPTQ
jgi:hypothetical protein